MAELKIEYLLATDLVPYESNSRTHSQQQVDQIKRSMNEFGFTNPILLDEHNGIIAGHGRLQAAQELGTKLVPTITLKGLTKAQRKAYVIADNQLALNAGWDFDALRVEIEDLDSLDFNLELLGFGEEELERILDIEEIPDSDSIYSDKITVPTYDPSNKKPPVVDLYEDEKAMELIVDIKESKLPQEEKDFLMAAASRHIVFNYSKVADFYSHSSKECQELMEKSALVIVDYRQAIANGFAHLTEKIDDLIGEE